MKTTMIAAAVTLGSAQQVWTNVSTGCTEADGKATYTMTYMAFADKACSTPIAGNDAKAMVQAACDSEMKKERRMLSEDKDEKPAKCEVVGSEKGWGLKFSMAPKDGKCDVNEVAMKNAVMKGKCVNPDSKCEPAFMVVTQMDLACADMAKVEGKAVGVNLVMKFNFFQDEKCTKAQAPELAAMIAAKTCAEFKQEGSTCVPGKDGVATVTTPIKADGLTCVAVKAENEKKKGKEGYQIYGKTCMPVDEQQKMQGEMIKKCMTCEAEGKMWGKDKEGKPACMAKSAPAPAPAPGPAPGSAPASGAASEDASSAAVFGLAGLAVLALLF